jgi:hypothetical protein
MMRILGLFSLLLLSLFLTAQEQQKVDFVRDVQPIFKASCLKCHGPEKPKGQFRLDFRALAMKGGVLGQGHRSGNSKESLLDPAAAGEGRREPDAPEGPALAPAKIELLRAWIDQGAVWPDAAAGDLKLETHWAYVAPVAPRSAAGQGRAESHRRLRPRPPRAGGHCSRRPKPTRDH